MSDSTPPKPKTNHDPLHASAEQGVWVLASTLIHGTLLAVVLVLIPLCSVAPSLREPEPSLAAEDIQEVAEQVERTQREAVEEDIERMREALERVREEQARREALLPEAESEPTPEPASDPVEDAFELMESALEAQEEAESAAESAEQTDDAEQIKERVERAAEKQAEADQLQREALNRLAETEAPMDPAIEAQMEAIAQQVRAQASLDDVQERLKAQAEVDATAEASSQQAERVRERELERWEGEQRRREQEVREIGERRDQARAALEAAEAALTDAKVAHAEAEQRLSDATEQTDQRQSELEAALAREREARQANDGPAIDRARQDADEARERVNASRETQKAARHDVSQANREVRSAKGDRDRHERELDRAEQDLARSQTALSTAAEKAAAAAAAVAKATAQSQTAAKTGEKHLAAARARIPEMKQAQAAARAAQTEAIRALGQTMAQQAASEERGSESSPSDEAATDAVAGETESSEAIDTAPRAESIDRPPSLTDLYEQARSLELRVARHYREASVAELALLQGIAMSEARRQVDVPVSARPDASEVLSTPQPVRTDARLQRLKGELTNMRREVGAMAQTVEAMAESAVGQDEAGLRLAGAAMQELANQRVKAERGLAELARETAGSPAVDLAAEMAAVDRIGESDSPPGATGSRNPDPDAGQSVSASGSGGPENQEQEPDQPLPTRVGGTAGAPPALTEEVRAKPGRRLTTSGPEADWLYLDAWYLAGPFPNPGRQNIHRQFPPETVVDLDAVYSGAGGRTVKWEFVQATEPMVKPEDAGEYTIWYAYTEVFLEEAADLWIAVGSDDRSDIWINGLKVWASSDQLKAWQIGEGYRKVHFREGVNRILYRIENGHGGMGFSLVIHTSRPAEAGE